MPAPAPHIQLEFEHLPQRRLLLDLSSDLRRPVDEEGPPHNVNDDAGDHIEYPERCEEDVEQPQQAPVPTGDVQRSREGGPIRAGDGAEEGAQGAPYTAVVIVHVLQQVGAVGAPERCSHRIGTRATDVVEDVFARREAPHTLHHGETDDKEGDEHQARRPEQGRRYRGHRYEHPLQTVEEADATGGLERPVRPNHTQHSHERPVRAGNHQLQHRDGENEEVEHVPTTVAPNKEVRLLCKEPHYDLERKQAEEDLLQNE
mmetsp:Transcript_114638/g.331296  ORF Transcript_114638/g.331296 Transcript_114638/m.331296 type:complete len:259 (-) Transcript_114638:970-1746(-)